MRVKVCLILFRNIYGAKCDRHGLGLLVPCLRGLGPAGMGGYKLKSSPGTASLASSAPRRSSAVEAC